MRTLILAAAATTAALSGLAAPQPAAAQRVVLAVGAPAGPGWHEWHERRAWRRAWNGPRWHGRRGPHYGWYRWHNSYYRNCSWRWRHGHREWHCW